MNYEKNCLSYWFPKLEEVGLPVPKTVWIDFDQKIGGVSEALRKMFWMEDLNDLETERLSKFTYSLKFMAQSIGYPLFMRTGQTSHKHSWEETCLVTNEKQLIKNAQALTEYSLMADMKTGLPINVWALRQIIETTPAFFAFNNMPITKEFRYFIKEGKIDHVQPYWPADAIEGHTQDKDWRLKLEAMNKLRKDEEKDVLELINKVATIFDGYWSVDVLKDKFGKWYVTDMATGEDSYIYGQK